MHEYCVCVSVCVCMCVCVCVCQSFISHTAVSSLPESILWGIQVLSAESVFTLKELPSPDHFPLLWEASLTYPSHCCAFQNMPRNR